MEKIFDCRIATQIYSIRVNYQVGLANFVFSGTNKQYAAPNLALFVRVFRKVWHTSIKAFEIN